jgi:hypothetical protein
VRLATTDSEPFKSKLPIVSVAKAEAGKFDWAWAVQDTIGRSAATACATSSSAARRSARFCSMRPEAS